VLSWPAARVCLGVVFLQCLAATSTTHANGCAGAHVLLAVEVLQQAVRAVKSSRGPIATTGFRASKRLIFSSSSVASCAQEALFGISQSLPHVVPLSTLSRQPSKECQGRVFQPGSSMFDALQRVAVEQLSLVHSIGRWRVDFNLQTSVGAASQRTSYQHTRADFFVRAFSQATKFGPGVTWKTVTLVARLVHAKDTQQSNTKI
jgi:hypothetical protein